MEMPEGWKALMDNNEKYGRFDSCYSLNLMREMAEALNIHVNGTIAQLRINPDQAVGYEALKKFKDWK